MTHGNKMHFSSTSEFVVSRKVMVFEDKNNLCSKYSISWVGNIVIYLRIIYYLRSFILHIFLFLCIVAATINFEFETNIIP